VRSPRKGVLRPATGYAKFKDVARATTAPSRRCSRRQQGRQRIFRQADGNHEASTTANLDFAQELISVKSPSEALELWTSHAKKQFETFAGHSKELAELTQKIATNRRADQGQCVEAVQAGRLRTILFARILIANPVSTSDKPRMLLRKCALHSACRKKAGGQPGLFRCWAPR